MKTIEEKRISAEDEELFNDGSDEQTEAPLRSTGPMMKSRRRRRRGSRRVAKRVSTIGGEQDCDPKVDQERDLPPRRQPEGEKNRCSIYYPKFAFE